MENYISNLKSGCFLIRETAVQVIGIMLISQFQLLLGSSLVTMRFKTWKSFPVTNIGIQKSTRSMVYFICVFN